MPAFYTITPGATQTTNATPSTANDCMFVAPGVASMWVTGYVPHGFQSGQTSLTAIGYRLEKWTTTASSGGTAVTPAPTNPTYRASRQTSGWSASTVTSGTGGPTLLASIGTGPTSPNQYIATRADFTDAFGLDASATQSIDVFNICPIASFVFEAFMTTAEGA
jgi:hypothetical protein